MIFIPKSFETTRRITPELENELSKLEGVYFEAGENKNEIIEVKFWQRYPSYDFIYGVPTPESPRYKKERACLSIRYNNGRSYCHYFDMLELKHVSECLSMIYRHQEELEKFRV